MKRRIRYFCRRSISREVFEFEKPFLALNFLTKDKGGYSSSSSGGTNLHRMSWNFFKKQKFLFSVKKGLFPF